MLIVSVPKPIKLCSVSSRLAGGGHPMRLQNRHDGIIFNFYIFLFYFSSCLFKIVPVPFEQRVPSIPLDYNGDYLPSFVTAEGTWTVEKERNDGGVIIRVKAPDGTCYLFEEDL